MDPEKGLTLIEIAEGVAVEEILNATGCEFQVNESSSGKINCSQCCWVFTDSREISDNVSMNNSQAYSYIKLNPMYCIRDGFSVEIHSQYVSKNVISIKSVSLAGV